MSALKLIVFVALYAMAFAAPRPGGLFGKNEHHTIHVPFKIHTIHHHHVQKIKVPVIKHVPYVKEIHVPVLKEIHVPVHHVHREEVKVPVPVPVHHFHHKEVPVHVVQTPEHSVQHVNHKEAPVHEEAPVHQEEHLEHDFHSSHLSHGSHGHVWK